MSLKFYMLDYKKKASLICWQDFFFFGNNECLIKNTYWILYIKYKYTSEHN